MARDLVFEVDHDLLSHFSILTGDCLMNLASKSYMLFLHQIVVLLKDTQASMRVIMSEGGSREQGEGAQADLFLLLCYQGMGARVLIYAFDVHHRWQRGFLTCSSGETVMVVQGNPGEFKARCSESQSQPNMNVSVPRALQG